MTKQTGFKARLYQEYDNGIQSGLIVNKELGAQLTAIASNRGYSHVRRAELLEEKIESLRSTMGTFNSGDRLYADRLISLVQSYAQENSNKIKDSGIVLSELNYSKSVIGNLDQESNNKIQDEVQRLRGIGNYQSNSDITERIAQLRSKRELNQAIGINQKSNYLMPPQPTESRSDTIDESVDGSVGVESSRANRNPRRMAGIVRKGAIIALSAIAALGGLNGVSYNYGKSTGLKNGYDKGYNQGYEAAIKNRTKKAAPKIEAELESSFFDNGITNVENPKPTLAGGELPKEPIAGRLVPYDELPKEPIAGRLVPYDELPKEPSVNPVKSDVLRISDSDFNELMVSGEELAVLNADYSQMPQIRTNNSSVIGDLEKYVTYAETTNPSNPIKNLEYAFVSSPNHPLTASQKGNFVEAGSYVVTALTLSNTKEGNEFRDNDFRFNKSGVDKLGNTANKIGYHFVEFFKNAIGIVTSPFIPGTEDKRISPIERPLANASRALGHGVAVPVQTANLITLNHADNIVYPAYIAIGETLEGAGQLATAVVKPLDFPATLLTKENTQDRKTALKITHALTTAPIRFGVNVLSGAGVENGFNMENSITEKGHIMTQAEMAAGIFLVEEAVRNAVSSDSNPTTNNVKGGETSGPGGFINGGENSGTGAFIGH
jgi:hypothetical protein